MMMTMTMTMTMIISRGHTTQSAMHAPQNRTLFRLEHGLLPLQHALPLHMLDPLFVANLSINTLGQGQEISIHLRLHENLTRQTHSLEIRGGNW
jgi:hypothetical protein